MYTVLRTTAGRTTLALALVAGSAVVLTAPAGAAAQPSHRPAPAHVAPAQSGSHAVEIGTAVAYERQPDGSIRQVR